MCTFSRFPGLLLEAPSPSASCLTEAKEWQYQGWMLVSIKVAVCFCFEGGGLGFIAEHLFPPAF